MKTKGIKILIFAAIISPLIQVLYDKGISWFINDVVSENSLPVSISSSSTNIRFQHADNTFQNSNNSQYKGRMDYINTSEAINYIGKDITICGTLAEINSRGNYTYLNIGNKYPYNVFAGVIEDSYSQEFKGINRSIGKQICIHGKIRKYGAKTGINMQNKYQLVR